MAPHFHVLLFLSNVDLHEFQCWLSLSWYEVCGKLDPQHLAAGTSCTKTRNWSQVRGYLSKYIAKHEAIQVAAAGIGRHYAIWWPEELSWRLRRVALTQKDGYRVHRWYRKFSGVKVRAGRDFECFVNASTTERLLKYLGYSVDAPPDVGTSAGGGSDGRRTAAGAGPPDAGSTTASSRRSRWGSAAE